VDRTYRPRPEFPFIPNVSEGPTLMANHVSAEKRIRRNARRAEINGARISRIRTFVKKVEKALALGDKDAAVAAFAVAEPELRRGVNKGVLHGNTASRKISRLSARVKALSQA
jgi:small subunit ribosomal protein S20